MPDPDILPDFSIESRQELHDSIEPKARIVPPILIATTRLKQQDEFVREQFVSKFVGKRHQIIPGSNKLGLGVPHTTLLNEFCIRHNCTVIQNYIFHCCSFLLSIEPWSDVCCVKGGGAFRHDAHFFADHAAKTFVGL